MKIACFEEKYAVKISIVVWLFYAAIYMYLKKQNLNISAGFLSLTGH